jgi:hypothetical protein
MNRKASKRKAAKGVSALVHTPVLEGRAPTIYVAHRKSGEWFVGGPGFTDDDDDAFRRVALDVAQRADPSIANLVNLPMGTCAYRSDSRAKWDRGHIPEGRTFLLTYEIRPTEPVSHGGTIGGAFANCWTVAQTISEARRQTRRYVEENGWLVVAVEKEQRLDEDELPEGGEEYYRQVQIDGLVCVFYTYPSEVADA